MALSSFPDWAMLDRHIYHRNDDDPFPADEPTMAACAISRGDTIRVCFKFDEPPRPSRVHLWWPGKGPCDRLSVVAAHRDAVLFQVIYKIKDCVFDVFEYLIYYMADGSRPSLDLIPHIEGTLDEFREAVEERRFRVTTQRLRRREDLGLAVLRRGHDWAVAELEVTDDAAELHVFRSGGGGRWEATRPPVVCHSAAEDMDKVRCCWRGHHSFSFGDYLCWVDYDYCVGGMFLCKVLDDEDPVLEYVALPATALDTTGGSNGGSSYHTIGVDEDRGLLKFLMISRDDGSVLAHTFRDHDCFDIKVSSWTWRIGAKNWEVAETVRPHELVLDHGLGELPCNGLGLPVVSKADMGTVYFMCKPNKVDEEVGCCPGEMFLVAISMVLNTVLAAYPRVEPEVDDPSAEKLSFRSLRAIDLPKYLKQLDNPTSLQGQLHNAPEVDNPSDKDLEDWVLI